MGRFPRDNRRYDSTCGGADWDVHTVRQRVGEPVTSSTSPGSKVVTYFPHVIDCSQTYSQPASRAAGTHINRLGHGDIPTTKKKIKKGVMGSCT